MSIGLLLIILLVVFLFSGGIPWGRYSTPGHYYGTGYYGGGGLGLILVIVLILVLLGHL
jgi:hypothetical protein